MTQVADHSYLSKFLECPRAFWYQYVERWEPKTEAIRLKAGSAMHKGLAVIHERWDIDRAVEAFKAEWKDNAGVGDLDFLTEGHLVTCLRNYYDRWEKDCPWKLVEMIEEPVIQEVNGMLVGGIPDMVVEDDGELVVVDHKTTTSYLGSHLYNRVKFAKQFPLYCILLSEKLGKPVRRAVCNAVYTGQYAASSTSKAQKFDRYSFEYDDEQLEETGRWISMVNWSITVTYSKKEFMWSQHGGSHCGWCSYSQLCEVSPPLRGPILESRFQRREIKGKLLSGADQ